MDMILDIKEQIDGGVGHKPFGKRIAGVSLPPLHMGNEAEFDIVAEAVHGVTFTKIKAPGPGLFYYFRGSEKIHELNLAIFPVTGILLYTV